MDEGVLFYRGYVLAFPKELNSLLVLDHLKSNSNLKWFELPNRYDPGYKNAHDNLIRSYPKAVVCRGQDICGFMFPALCESWSLISFLLLRVKCQKVQMFRISKCPQGKAELLTSEFPMSLQIFCWQHVTILLVFGCFKILEIFLFSTLHLSSLGLKKLGKSELFKVQYLHDSNLLLYSISYYRFGSFK